MKEKLKILTYTLTYLVKIDFKYISLVLIKSVLFGIMPVINLKLTQILLDSLTRGQEIEFIKILIFISVFTCISELVGFSIKKIEEFSLLEINKFINIDILNKIKKLDAKKLETSETYDIINRVGEDFTVAMLDSLNIILDVFSAIIASLSYIVIVLSYNIFFLVILIVPIIRFLVEKKYVILEYNNRLNNTQSEIRKNYIYAMTSDSENFKELKVYRAFDYFISIFKQLKILMGIYGDYCGHIYVNGIDFSEIDIFSYRNRINVMFQNYIKYRSSIKENIFLDKNAKDEEVSKYLSSLGMDGLIDDINSNLGYEFDEGRWLSEGQWQKLAFLRLINKECEMYLLDEPSASLDIVSERKLLNILEKISGFKIIICHRFNEYTLKSDEIIMLKDGEIIAKGNHNQMLKICEDYREMYKIYIETYSYNKSTDVL